MNVEKFLAAPVAINAMVEKDGEEHKIPIMSARTDWVFMLGLRSIGLSPSIEETRQMLLDSLNEALVPEEPTVAGVEQVPGWEG